MSTSRSSSQVLGTNCVVRCGAKSANTCRTCMSGVPSIAWLYQPLRFFNQQTSGNDLENAEGSSKSHSLKNRTPRPQRGHTVIARGERVGERNPGKPPPDCAATTWRTERDQMADTLEEHSVRHVVAGHVWGRFPGVTLAKPRSPRAITVWPRWGRGVRVFRERDLLSLSRKMAVFEVVC